MINLKKSLALVLVVCLLLTMAGCGNSGASPSAGKPAGPAHNGKAGNVDLGKYSIDNPLLIRLATFDKPNNNPLTTGSGIIMGNGFIERIKEQLGDAVKVEFYTGGEMGQDGEIFEGISAGTLQMSITMGGTVNRWCDDFKVLDLPYLFEGGWPHALAFLKSDLAKELKDAVNKDVPSVVCAGIRCAGPRNLANNKRPVTSAADLKGMTVRVMQSDIYLAAMKSFGAIAVPMAGGEVVTALQQGTIDGEENNPVADYSNGFNEVTKYYSETRHVMMFETMCCNADWLNSLTADLRKIVLDCANATCIETSVDQEKRCADCVNGIEKDYKNTVVRYENVDIQSFKTLTKSVYDDFIAKYGSDKIDAIRKLTY